MKKTIFLTALAFAAIAGTVVVAQSSTTLVCHKVSAGRSYFYTPYLVPTSDVSMHLSHGDKLPNPDGTCN